MDSTSSGNPSIKLKLGTIRKLGNIAITNAKVVTKKTVRGRLTTNLPIGCQIGGLDFLCWSGTILFGQNANRDIKTIAAGKTVKATKSIIVTVIASIGPMVLKDPSMENMSKNMATTVVMDEPKIEGATRRMAEAIAANLSREFSISSRYLETIKRT